MTGQMIFRGFANPVDPTAEELREWAYHPESVALAGLPPDWDLMVASDRLIGTVMELAMDPRCTARRFAMHCLYIYAADTIRTRFRAHPKRRFKRLLEEADTSGQEPLYTWAHNVRALLRDPDLFDYADWCQGGLVRRPRRL